MRFGAGRVPGEQSVRHLEVNSFPAPVGGLWTNAARSDPPPNTAIRLDNYIPTMRGIKARGGTAKVATVASAAPVMSMWKFTSGGSGKVFAATADSIFEVTNPADPDVIPAADVSSLTGGNFSTHEFSTSAGDYLYAVNGEDNALLYDGSSWTSITGVSTPALTGVNTDDLISVWSHAKRLWFIEKNSKSAWFLPVDSIGGALSEFILTGLLRKGGDILFGTTWSLDTGEGLDDKCVFVSTNGEVIVYSGTDPTDPNSWSLQGVYETAKPLGKTAFYHIGGEPFILTQEGIMGLSSVITRERSEQRLYAASLAIEDDWRRAVSTRNTKDWKPVRWPYGGLVIIPMPAGTAADEPQHYIMNSQTAAWARWLNYDVTCGVEVGTSCYIASSEGLVYTIETGGTDDGDSYECLCVLAFSDLGSPGAYKTIHQARGTFVSANPVNAKISASADYELSIPAYPSSVAEFSDSIWDTSLWDQGTWAASPIDGTAENTGWVSIGISGYAHALQVQQSFGTLSKPFTELLRIDVTYDAGGYAV